MDDNTYINANDLLDAAKDHYWDSLEHERELIIKHIEGIISCFITPEQDDDITEDEEPLCYGVGDYACGSEECEFCPYQDTCR
jgi:hypothetical protein